MSYIFSCAAFAGAVGGLIGYGLVRIETGSIVGWQWLYICEGAITLCLAPLAYFWVPNTLTEAWFLNDDQKQLAAKRYELNKRHFDEKETFRWSEVVKALTDWRVYTSGAIQFAADVTLYGISTFMPQIIRAMGFSNVMAQALTVPGTSPFDVLRGRADEQSTCLAACSLSPWRIFQTRSATAAHSSYLACASA